ncbi:MAG: hypothetical protein ACI4C4_08405 [Lachnospiraceae bacterium]
MIKHQKVEIKERDEWSSLAEFLGNIIVKYAETVDLDFLPEPDKYLAQKRIKGIYKKYMELSKHQRKNIRWVDYPNIWC